MLEKIILLWISIDKHREIRMKFTYFSELHEHFKSCCFNFNEPYIIIFFIGKKWNFLIFTLISLVVRTFNLWQVIDGEKQYFKFISHLRLWMALNISFSKFKGFFIFRLYSKLFSRVYSNYILIYSYLYC